MKKHKYMKRTVALFCSVCILFAALLGRIAYLQNSSLRSVADTVGEKTIEIGESRGYIYDRNYVPLVNNSKLNFAVVVSGAETADIVRELLNENSTDGISDGFFIVTQTETPVRETKWSQNIEIIQRYSDNVMLPHIIGYLDYEGNGVCGIEKSFNKILDSHSGKLKISYTVDARQQAVAGDGVKIINENYDSPGGIVLTADSEIQQIAEAALADGGIETGCAIVLDVASSQILALVSLPEYDINNLSDALNDSNRPFLNRAFSAYPAGSVFKPIVAAAALENGIMTKSDFSCAGTMNINGQIFSCYNKTAHSQENLSDAVCNSCNTYFIELGLRTGKEKICDICKKFGFGTSIELTNNLVSVEGNLPLSDEITSDAQLANMCFGQGELLVTPLQLAAAYCVFANHGVYTEPYILKELVNDAGEKYAYYKSEVQYQAVSDDVCTIINECLYKNMLDGISQDGNPSYTTAAGKTGTAQTGDFSNNGEERLCTWFAGFFPYENPQYVVVVFNENGSTGSKDCAPVFRHIADNITKLRGVQEEFSDLKE
ncbi:MAG: penicillin-binding protein 2 [Clostridia bacterium]|nr:penicillin-binding protein 2 [Clostridia bacterium]